MASKTSWQNLERWVAEAWSRLTDQELHRVPLSGISSRHNAGDVIIPRGYDMLIECKYRNAMAVHRAYKDAVEDAAKNGINPKNVMLYTKTHYQHGVLVTLDADTFHRIVDVGLLALEEKYKNGSQ